MKITKYLHSCLLVEHDKSVVLIDPGSFTYQAKVLPIQGIKQLDYILITHEHQDHLSIELINELIAQFPTVQIVSNPSVAKVLASENIPVHTDLSVLPPDAKIQFEEVPHEQLWDAPVPQNILFHVWNKLTHPGDSYHIETSKEILALPIQAPWGSTADAVKLALHLKPKIIIPIHDWLLKDEVRKMMYQRLQAYFKHHKIDFKPLETGDVIEV